MILPEPILAIDGAYPQGAVIALLDGPLVTPATGLALRRRLDPPDDSATGSGLSADQFAVLSQIAARLLPQTDRAMPIDCAGEFDRRLRAGMIGDGWRYADLPPDADAHSRGLALVDQTSQARFGCRFGEASADEQDDLLRDVQFGRVAWPAFSAVHWFEELLAALVDVYYAHPVALDEIGYAGMADARGWQDVGRGARAPHEPEPIA